MPDTTSAAGPGREVEVALHRLPRWLAGFAERHGPTTHERVPPPDALPPDAGVPDWRVTAQDGARAVVHGPAWLVHLGPAATADEGPGPADWDHGDPAAALAGLRPDFGVLLVRRAGYAVARFAGADLVERKVGSRHVHGRTAAGGWSQQRYARRRANQADEIAEAAARAAARILGDADAAAVGAAPGPAGPVRFLVTGGDRPLLAAALAGAGTAIAGLPVPVHLAVGTPDARVLASVPDCVLAVTITVHDLG
jgi:hypothetical protein